MTERFDWKTVADRRDVVHQAVATLTRGGLALFPTDTLYQLVASAKSSDGVARFTQAVESFDAANRNGQTPRLKAVLSLARPIDLHRFAPKMPIYGRRLVDRCLPGPLVIVADRDALNGELNDFPAEVGALVLGERGLAMQVADHPSLLQTLRLLGTPLAAASVPGGTDSAAALERCRHPVDAIIDDGATRFGKPPTVVGVSARGAAVLHEGILTASRVHRMAGEIVTFVCTGNTCRSPMAEGIFKRIAADDLGCEPGELSDRGYTILSAGVAAAVGAPPADEAVRIAREYNAGIEDHSTTPLTSELVRLSDRIVTMTREHRAIVVDLWPDAAPKTTTLAGDQDISDPIGYPLERYRQCAAQMAEHLRRLWRRMRGD